MKKVLPNLKIRTKLFFGLLLLVLISGVVAYTSGQATIKTRDQFTELTSVDTPRLVALFQIGNSAIELDKNVSDFSTAISKNASSQGVETEKSDLLANLERLGTAEADYHRHVKAELDEEDQTPEESNEVKDEVNAVLLNASELIAAHEQKVSVVSIIGLREQLQQSLDNLDKVVGKNIDIELFQLNKSNLRTNQNVSALLRNSLVLEAIALASAITIGIILTRLIALPLAELRRGVLAVTQGNLQHKIKVDNKDELGQVAAAFNDMSQKLHDSYDLLEAEKAGVERQVEVRTQQLSEEQSRFISSINSLRLGFMMTNALDHVIYSNPVLWKVLGVGINNYQEVGEVYSKLKLQEHIKTCRESRKPINISEMSFGAKILRLLLSPVLNSKNSEVLGVVVLVEDITEAKVLERSKDEFFSIASHELRTPLTAIRGNASMIKQIYSPDFKDQDLNQMVDDIHQSSLRLIEIVNVFLDVSRIEQGKMEFKDEVFDISDIIENVTYELTAVLKEKKLYVKVNNTLHQLPKGRGDMNRLKQVLYNLVGNALKYTEHGGVTIDVRQEGNLLHVFVQDTGIGIPADKQPLLFHKFQQAGSSLYTRDSTRGTGLGLYISKLIIEHMGGSLRLEKSVVGQGTTFRFTIPIANSPQPSPVDQVINSNTDDRAA